MNLACVDAQQRSAQLLTQSAQNYAGFGALQHEEAVKIWISSCVSVCSRVNTQLDAALQVYAGPLMGGSRAVVLFNRHSITTQYPISNVTVTWEQLGYPADMKAYVRDLHAERTLGTFQSSFTAGVDIHDAVMVKVTPQQPKQEYEEWRPWSQRHRASPVSSMHLAKSMLQQGVLEE